MSESDQRVLDVAMRVLDAALRVAYAQRAGVAYPCTETEQGVVTGTPHYHKKRALEAFTTVLDEWVTARKAGDCYPRPKKGAELQVGDVIGSAERPRLVVAQVPDGKPNEFWVRLPDGTLLKRDWLAWEDVWVQAHVDVPESYVPEK